MMGKAKAQQKLIDNLEGEFGKVRIRLSTSVLLTCMMHDSLIHLKCIYMTVKFKTGTKGVPSTSRGLPKC